jgi:hypothetical protein
MLFDCERKSVEKLTLVPGRGAMVASSHRSLFPIKSSSSFLMCTSIDLGHSVSADLLGESMNIARMGFPRDGPTPIQSWRQIPRGVGLTHLPLVQRICRATAH